MAHSLASKPQLTTPATSRSNAPGFDSPEVRQAGVDLAACFRLAARPGRQEDICNHFSAMVPGYGDLFLVDPYGSALCKATASSLLICDYQGNGIEGERIAAAIGGADIVFMKHHGVMAVGKTIAEAWDDLYYLERACEVQLLAMSTGRAIIPVQAQIAEPACQQMRHGDAESAALHLNSAKRQLDRAEPDYRN